MSPSKEIPLILSFPLPISSCPHSWSPIGRNLNPRLYTDRFDHDDEPIFLENVCERESDEQDANRTKPQ